MESITAYKQICKKCLSEDVMTMRWINPNTGEVALNQAGTEGLVDWCNNCRNETTLTDKSDKPKDMNWDGTCEECGSPDIQYCHSDAQNVHYLQCNECKHVFDASLR